IGATVPGYELGVGDSGHSAARENSRRVPRAVATFIWRRGFCLADRMRQRSESAAGARFDKATRDRHSSGFGCKPWTTDSSTADRKFDTWVDWRRAWAFSSVQSCSISIGGEFRRYSENGRDQIRRLGTALYLGRIVGDEPAVRDYSSHS